MFIHPSIASTEQSSLEPSKDGWTRYQDYKVKLDVPQGWKIVKDLYGMPIMVLGPEREHERAVLSVQHTDVPNIVFNHKKIKENSETYYTARKEFIEGMGELTFTSKIPYEKLNTKTGSEGFQIGFRYQSDEIEREEKSIHITCRNKLYLLKTLTNNQLPNEDKTTISKIVSNFDCQNIPITEEKYQPSPLQGLADKIISEVNRNYPWPTKDDFESASINEKADAIKALVEYQKGYEDAASLNGAYDNLNSKNESKHSSLKTNIKSILNLLTSSAEADSNGSEYNCFFAGWPSKYVEKNGIWTCDYPSNTNNKYKSTCGEGKLSCNPSLFGSNNCIDLNNSNERSRATLVCDMNLQAAGKTYNDVVNEKSFDKNTYQQAMSAAKDVCSQEEYSNENFGLCNTLKENLNEGINSKKIEKNSANDQFLNGMDEVKPENFDEFVNKTASDYEKFKKDCIKDGKVKEDSDCASDYEHILADLEKIEKKQTALEQEINDQVDENKNENCDQADCSKPKETINEKISTRLESKNNSCSKEEIKRINSTECGSIIGMVKVATNCQANLITSIISSLWGTIKALGQMIWSGVKAVGNMLVAGGKYLGSLFGYESESSKKVTTAAQTSDSFIMQLMKEPKKTAGIIIDSVWKSIKDFISNDVACEEWSGVPHFSKCTKSASSWSCMSCEDKFNTSCSAIGYVAAEIIPAIFTGGATAGIKGAALSTKIGLKIASSFSKLKALGKLASIESKIAKGTKLGKRVSSTLKTEAKLLEGTLGKAGKLSKTQRAIVNTYKISRWPAGKLKQIKLGLLAANKIIKTRFGNLKNTISNLKVLQPKIVRWPVKKLYQGTKFVTYGAPKWTANKIINVSKGTYNKVMYVPERILASTSRTRNAGQTAEQIANLQKGYRKYYTTSLIARVPGDRVGSDVVEAGKVDFMTDDEIKTLGEQKGFNGTISELKKILKQNIHDERTKKIVFEKLNNGEFPRDADFNHYYNTRKIGAIDLEKYDPNISKNEIIYESILERLEKAASTGETPKFSNHDYKAYMESSLVSNIHEAKKQIEQEVEHKKKIHLALEKLKSGDEPNVQSLSDYALSKNMTLEQFIIGKIRDKKLDGLGQKEVGFSNFEIEFWANLNGIPKNNAKKEFQKYLNTNEE